MGSDDSCGLSEAFGGSGSARMSSGCCSSGGSGSGGAASAGAGLKSLPPRAPPSASSQQHMHPALKHVPVGRAGPSGDLGEAVARLGVRFSFMGDGGSE